MWQIGKFYVEFKHCEGTRSTLGSVRGPERNPIDGTGLHIWFCSPCLVESRFEIKEFLCYHNTIVVGPQFLLT